MKTRTRPPAWISVLTAATLLCCCIYSLYDAINQAQSSGLVEVMSSGRRTPREKVPWPHAWAYFSGLLILSVGFVLWLLNELGRSRALLRIIVLIFLGTTLLILSGSLASLAGATGILGLLVALALTFLVGRRFGRGAALWFWALLVVAVIANGIIRTGAQHS
jgi:hypothetical protein